MDHVTNRRADVIAAALDVLDRHGLADLSMRRLAAELGVQPSALYHHVANKQTLLAAVADTVLERGARPAHPSATWEEEVVSLCEQLRDAMLAYRDGAELVTTVHAFGLGATAPGEELTRALRASGMDDEGVRVAARTLLHFVFGHTGEEQTHLQAAGAGAIEDELPQDSDFHLGLDLVLDGVRQRVRRGSGAPSARSGPAPRR